MLTLNRLKPLHADMRNRGETRCVFPFQMNGKGFSCIFIIDMQPYRLYVSSLGKAPFTIEVIVNPGYTVNTFLGEDYGKVCQYLELRYNAEHPFKPLYLFEEINNQAPGTFSRTPSYHEVLKSVSLSNEIEESNKIYFCGWRNNPIGAHVSELNSEKTRIAFGDKQALFCIKNNISSRWTECEDDEILVTLNQMN